MTSSDHTTPLKRCTKCGEEKPATSDYFIKDSSKRDGLYSSCRLCYKIPVVKAAVADGYKRCTKCEKVKLLTEFTISNGKPHSWCKDCCRVATKSRYIPSPRVKASPEELQARKRAQDREYGRKNRKHRREYRRVYYTKNKELLNQRSREWSARHPEAQKARKAKRRALEANAVGEHSRQDIELQYRSQNGRCWWCGKKVGREFHVDHLTPLNRGGTNNANNIVISCPKCNHSRRDKMPHEWSDRLI